MSKIYLIRRKKRGQGLRLKQVGCFWKKMEYPVHSPVWNPLVFIYHQLKHTKTMIVFHFGQFDQIS